MTVPCFRSDELIQYLREHNWVIVEDRFWEETNRLILGNNGSIFVLQSKNKYFFLEVVKGSVN
jgi:hypothetical protein